VTPEVDQMQAYAYWFFTVALVVVLYAYILHLYRREKKGEEDYERFGRLALDDELSDPLIEENRQNSDNDTSGKEK
jgi:cytochrome c oxidase cbb3-type subunit IV